jgi:glucosamine--fructose-6-phosphate aminotransferase (isomerizing)
MTGASTSWMRRETLEAGAAVARLWSRSGEAIRKAGALLRDLDPPFIALCARGSSDHAAIFFKYACEMQLGLPVVAMGPSIASVYQTPLRLKGAVMLLISQSGRSPDLIAMAKSAQAGGAKVIAIVNDADSPAAELADLTIALGPGPRRASPRRNPASLPWRRASPSWRNGRITQDCKRPCNACRRSWSWRWRWLRIGRRWSRPSPTRNPRW